MRRSQRLCFAGAREASPLIGRAVRGGEARLVCTENLIRVDDVMESPKLAE
jgi:hypothetical protein